MHSLLLGIAKYAYLEIFIALGLGIAGLPIPDETLLAYAGFLVSQGKLNFLYTILVAFGGTSCGITIGYIIGKTLGKRIVKRYATKLHVTLEDIHKAEIFYHRYGTFALFIGYFIPGARHLTAILAGASLMPYHTFARFAYTGGLLWTITLVSVGYLLGEKWRHVYMYSHRFITPLALLTIIAFLIVIYWKKLKDRTLS